MSKLLLIIIILYLSRTRLSRPTKRGYMTITTLLWPWGQDGAYKFVIELGYPSIDEYAYDPNYGTLSWGLFDHRGYAWLALVSQLNGAGIAILNRYIGFWHDEECYLYNKRRWIPPLFME